MVIASRKVIPLPTPKGPIRKHDVHRPPVPTVPEQRRRACAVGSAVVPRPYHRPVVAVEHELQVRDPTRIPPQKLQDSPHGEQVSRLYGLLVLLHVCPAVDDHQPEVGRPSGSFHHVPLDPRVPPRFEVLVDPPEVVRARDRFLSELIMLCLECCRVISLRAGDRSYVPTIFAFEREFESRSTFDVL